MYWRTIIRVPWNVWLLGTRRLLLKEGRQGGREGNKEDDQPETSLYLLLLPPFVYNNLEQDLTNL